MCPTCLPTSAHAVRWFWGQWVMEDGMAAQDQYAPCRRSCGLARLLCWYAHSPPAPAPAALQIAVEDVVQLLRMGQANRRTGETNMNERSSRSHRCVVAMNAAHGSSQLVRADCEGAKCKRLGHARAVAVPSAFV